MYFVLTVEVFLAKYFWFWIEQILLFVLWCNSTNFLSFDNETFCFFKKI